MTNFRADLYHALAEALADPPDWLARPGREWPLFESAVRLTTVSAAARRAVETLAEVPAESLAARRARYATLFVGTGRHQLWLYESAALSGQLLGPETWAVEKLYHAAGLDTIGAELADHASLELAFLSHLAAGGHASIERSFIAQHAGRWLPDVGRAMLRSGDPVYAPIGQLLADWLFEAPHPRRAHTQSSCRRVPVILAAAACTLCGFCVQVCPTRALAVHETEDMTALLLSNSMCMGCGKCERVCETHALAIQSSGEVRSSTEWRVLRQSPRARCRGCEQPMVSRAELEFVAGQIGRPAWLEYCPDCRPYVMENLR